MNHAHTIENPRILVIDDNESIHADFRKIFGGGATAANELDALDAELFGSPSVTHQPAAFQIDYAFQGQQGLAMTEQAKQLGQPYALAFVDVRMPPGWDGIETTLRLWSADPRLQVVICTAYSDLSWEQTIERLGVGDRFLILKKPFDIAEVRQLALLLSVKWTMARQAQERMEDLEHRVSERTEELSGLNTQLRAEISERERLQLGMVRAQKLESLGHLVAGVAHEINNPLAFIISNLSFLEDELKRPLEEVGESLGEIGEVLQQTSSGAGRIQRIVRDLKTFCRTDEGGAEPVDVNQVLDSALSLARGEINRVATITRNSEQVPQVLANGSRLGQVFLNLVINAVQALPSGSAHTSQIAVRTRHEGDDVYVEISDNGCGISPENLGRIFDPFFTTKPPGQGTGLGLSICHGIVEAFGGGIEVESELGKGTTFRVRLRRLARTSPDAAA